MCARWSKTICEGTRSRIGMTSMIFAAGALIWTCQPRSLTRFDSGSIISGVVAPACARLKRIPRTPKPVQEFELFGRHGVVDDRDHPRRRAECGQCLEMAPVVGTVGRRLYEDVARRPDALLQST